MKINNYEIQTIKKALTMRAYDLDQLILSETDTVLRDFYKKERTDCIDLIKKMKNI